MSKYGKTLREEQVQNIIGNILRGGVFLSAAIALVGGIFFLLHYGHVHPDYRVFKGEPVDLRSVSGILKDLASLRSRGIIQFGLLLLMATPVARVAFSILVFVLQRDRIYVVVTIIVLTALIYSIAGGGLR
jgi:uncharacterized membrane protein